MHSLRAAPLYSIVSIKLFILTKSFLLLAMILPWQLLSTVIKNKEQLNYGLLFLIVLVVFLHFLFDWFWSKVVELGASKMLLLKANKGSFNNYHGFSLRAYKYLMIFLSGIIFVFICFYLFLFVFICFLYFNLFVFLLI